MSIYAHFLALEMSLVKSTAPTKIVAFSQIPLIKNSDFDWSSDKRSSDAFQVCQPISPATVAVGECAFWGKLEPIKPSFSYLQNFRKNTSQLPILVADLPATELDAKTDILSKLNIEDNPLQLPAQIKELETTLVPLTLVEAQRIATASNRQLKITRLELDRARASLAAEQAGWFPSLNVQSSFDRTQSPFGEIQANTRKDVIRKQAEAEAARIPELESRLASLDPQDPRNEQEIFQLREQLQQAGNLQNQIDSIKNFATTSINGSVGLQYSLYSPQRQAGIAIAREQVNFNQLEVDRLAEEIELQVAEAYYNLQQADREVAIAETDVETRKIGVANVTRLLDAFLATRLDLLNAEVELDNALQVLKNNRVEQQIARRNLAQILSLPADVTPTAKDEVDLDQRWQLSLEETILLALNNRVELEQQLAQRRQGKAQRSAAWAAIKPQVNLFANYDFLQQYSDEPGDSVAKGFGDGYSVGLNFNWTLWDGGAASARAKEANSAIAIAEQRYADRANTIRFEVEQAYFQLPATLENVDTATQAVQRAKEAVAAAQMRFKANLNTQTEVLDAQNRLIQAENNLVRATLGYNRALAALKRAVGESRQEDVSSLSYP